MSQSQQAPSSNAERIAASLRDEILRSRWRTGDRLPSERELALRFGAHRGAVREALKKLEQLGLAEIRRGGARVAPIGQASLDIVRHLVELDSPPDPVLLDQILEVFGGLFSLAARLAAERGDDAQHARAQGILARLIDEALPIADEHALIHELSALFVEASQNMILPLVRNGLQTKFIERIDDHQQLLRPKEDERKPLLAAVARALAERDGPAAGQAVYELTQAVRRNAVELLTAERDRHPDAPASGAPRS